MRVGDKIMNKKSGQIGEIMEIRKKYIRVKYGDYRFGRSYIECVNLPITQTDGVVLL